jgi:CO dehydrogenase maturation factor
MKKVIVAGKGGAGKTTIISLVLNQFLAGNSVKTLVIDADPSSNLLISLGLEKPEIEALGELKDLIPENWDDFNPEFFDKAKKLCIKQLSLNGKNFDYIYLGHHVNNSCLCAYNNSLNYFLRHIEKTDDYDYVIMDREAGVEHINRSVYGREEDKLIVVSWPSSEYLIVAKDIYDLADMLGTTKNRLLVINNNQGLEFSENDLQKAISEIGLPADNYLVVNKVNVFDGLRKMSAAEILSAADIKIINSINQIIEFIKK